MVTAMPRATAHPMDRGHGSPCRPTGDLPCCAINVLPVARAKRELQKINTHIHLIPIGPAPLSR